MTQLSRRDVLKLIALASATLAARPLASLLDRRADSSSPNVIVFIFDAWSAAHLKMHGYPRMTMPNLERFADRCHVYHNHYSSGSFTVPGTASLLTGLQPWEHRALQLTASGVAPAHQPHNFFRVFNDSHHTVGYGQNPYADIFLHQFREDIETYMPQGLFNLENNHVATLPIFDKDYQIAFASFENNIFRNGKGAIGSLYFGMLSRLAGLSRYASLRKEHLREYPFGPPTASGYFMLEALADGLIESMQQFTSPTAAYLHLFPPHGPYTPTRDYASLFDDGWTPPEKPIHPLSRTRYSPAEMAKERQRYDQYLAAWDAEFARVIESMTSSGLLDNSIVIITSDHGELFERGEIEHNTSVLASPVVHVPLLVSLPGQTERKDIHAFTSSVDLLPTIANLTGVEVPTWGEGRLLPELGGEEDPDRPIFSMDGKSASSFAPIRPISISMIRQRHRLIHYAYPEYTAFEFYDLDADPEEMIDLFSSAPSLAMQMKDELLQKMDEFNRPYQKKN